MAAGTPMVSLWVKAEPFSYGALPVPPHPRLSTNNLKKIVPYCKTKGKNGFPRMNYSVWKHIACNKLQLTEDLAWMYFTVCHLLSEATSARDRADFDLRLARCTVQVERDALKNSLSVSTFVFVLYLYIQQLHKVSLKASLLAGDEWPLRARSPDLENRTGSSSSKTLDEHCHLQFVQTHIQEILELLVEPDVYNSAILGDFGITVEAVEALDFLIGASTDRGGSLQALHQVAMIPPLQSKFGYSKLTRLFSIRTLQSWIRGTVSQNPFGISACITSGKRLSWPVSAEESRPADKESGDAHRSKRGRIATNSPTVPDDHVLGNKIIIMSQVSKQTIGRSSRTLENSSVKIHRCHYSYLYLLSPLRSVTIEKCRHSVIVLGPVETTIHISHCEQVTVISPCRNIMISGSTLCVLYLLTPQRPLILGGNDTILLAPYHTFYPQLESHMAQAGLGEARNLWDQPLCIGPDHKDEVPVWELLPVAEFFTFNIPFEMEGTTQAWLADTGHKRELDSLVVPLQSQSKKP
ncbi:TBCC domain-containing protein 1-like isoform X2 [Liolophura sinensis]|uniref:TBCC domain-containing protein 1-like isoform X2 n=1 Tax=Liolophura sinensis TaxID=3198878 RepID=UPI003158BA36